MADTYATYGTVPGSKQTEMLAEQDAGFESDGFFSTLGDTVSGVLGSSGFSSLLGAAGALAGGFGAFSRGQIPVGYQGGIPEYAAVRQKVPGAEFSQPGIAQALTQPIQPAAETPQGIGQVTRRGYGEPVYGRRYLTDVRYSAPESAAAARQAAATEAEGLAQLNRQRAAQNMAAGGIASIGQPRYLGGPTDGMGSIGQPRYLGGPTDGMADQIPANIDGQQEAALSDGEFVIPADVVSHLGNGNSNAGANKLYDMMSQVRKDRTGTAKQGKQINPNRYMPG